MKTLIYFILFINSTFAASTIHHLEKDFKWRGFDYFIKDFTPKKLNSIVLKHHKSLAENQKLLEEAINARLEGVVEIKESKVIETFEASKESRACLEFNSNGICEQSDENATWSFTKKKKVLVIDQASFHNGRVAKTGAIMGALYEVQVAHFAIFGNSELPRLEGKLSGFYLDPAIKIVKIKDLEVDIDGNISLMEL